MKRTRLSKGNSAHKKSRLPTEEMFTKAEEATVKAQFDGDVEKEMKGDGDFNLGRVLHKIKSEVTEEFKALGEKKEKLGGLLHEMIYLEKPEDVELTKNLEVVKRLMSRHPSENVLIKVELSDEPSPDADLRGMVRAEDFLNFEHIEISMPEGDVYTIPRTNIKEVIGVAPQSAPVHFPMSVETLGGVGSPDVIPAVPVQVGDVGEKVEAEKSDEQGEQ